MSSEIDEEQSAHTIGAMSLAKFAEVHSISRSHLYTLFEDGKGPVTMKVGGRRLVSFKAAEEWRKRMEQKPNSNDNEGDDK